MSAPNQSFSREQAHQRLVKAAKCIADKHRDKLEELKQGARKAEAADWLWEALLISFSTMGNARGVIGLIRNEENHCRVRFDALAKLPSDKDRLRVLRETLHAAKVRMPDTKAEWLVTDFNRVTEMGGPAQAKELLFGLHGRDEKMKLLREFKGIGKKYSRNLLMDIYDADFRDSIAIDQRILSISRAEELSFKDYEEHEQFYLDVGKDAGLNGWTLDRLMYQFKGEFLEQLGLSKGSEKTKAASAA